MKRPAWKEMPAPTTTAMGVLGSESTRRPAVTEFKTKRQYKPLVWNQRAAARLARDVLCLLGSIFRCTANASWRFSRAVAYSPIERAPRASCLVVCAHGFFIKDTTEQPRESLSRTRTVDGLFLGHQLLRPA